MAVASEVKGERSRLSLLAVVLRFMRLCAMATASMQDLQPQHSANEHRQQQPPTLWRRSAALRHGRPASERVRGP